MLVDVQLILLFTHFCPLHDMFPQDLRDALSVLDALRRFGAAGFEAAVRGEGLAGVGAGGEESL